MILVHSDLSGRHMQCIVLYTTHTHTHTHTQLPQFAYIRTKYENGFYRL